MPRITATLICIALVTGCGGGGGGGGSPMTSCPALAGPSSPAESVASLVDGIAASEMKARNLPGLAISISKNGVILYAQGYGYASLKSCSPVLADTVFQIGSVTKQFTAAAVLKLVAAGTLGLDQSVSEILPAYTFDSRITIRMLLNHTAGLVDYTSFPEAVSWTNGVAQQTVLTKVSQSPPLFTPGSAYSYSDSNYYVLGAVIEAVTGHDYADYLTANILQPIPLSHTSYLQPPSSAAPYKDSGADGASTDPTFAFSSGALWSNVEDLAVWNGALMSGAVVANSQFTLMVTPPDVPIFQQSGRSQYGMGWYRTTALGHPYVLHDGKTLSYSAFNGLFLDDGFSIAIVSNIELPGATSFEGTATMLINAICGSPATSSTC